MIAEIIGVGSPDAAGGYGQPPLAEAQVFAREVSLLGVDLHYQTDAGGDQIRLAQAMAQALRRSDIIITCGGVGLEPGDYTREVICQGLGIPMDLHTESYQRIRAWYEAAGLPVPGGAQRAAMAPRGGIVFPGEAGRAPGVAVTAGDQCIIILPGAPDELAPMFMNSVVPFLAKFSGATIASRVARLFGIDEREAAQKLYDLQNARNPIITLYAQRGEILARVTARANSRAQAAGMCTPPLKEIVGRLGDYVYGIDVDSLEAVVVTHLTQKGFQLAAAESCTGGLLTQKLNLIPGAANCFKFGVSAKADRVKIQALKVPEKVIKKFGSVSDRCAVHMACGALDAGDADIGVAITGVAGPSAESDLPSGTVYIAVCDKNNAAVRKLSLPGDTDVQLIRETAVKHALNMVRLMLDYDPEPMPGAVPLAGALKGRIELCGPAEAARTAAADPEGPAPRARRGPEPRTVVMAVLIVILIAALGFIGFALYDKYFPDGLPFFSDTSASEEEEDPSEPPPEDEPAADEDGPPADDGDGPPVDDGDLEDDISGEGDGEPIGPEVSRKRSSSEEETDVDADADGDPGEDGGSEADAASAANISAPAPQAPAAPPPPVTQMVSSAASSQPPAPAVSRPGTASSSYSPPAKPEASSSGTGGRPLEPGKVYNLYTGKTSSASEADGQEDADGDSADDEGWSAGGDEPIDFSSSGADEGGVSGQYGDSQDEEDSENDSRDEEDGEGDSRDEEDGEDDSRDQEDGEDDSQNDEDGGGEITVRSGGKNVTASAREIVERIVQVEMGASFHAEALKAQSVAAYTYLQYRLARGQTPDVYLASKSAVSSKVSAAVAEVIGKQILYNGKPIDATYFASSAGVTNDSEDVWGDALPYLRSVDSGESVSEKTVRVSREKVRDEIEDTLGVDTGGYNEDEWISGVSYCENGEYVDEVEFCGEKSKPGAWVRANMFTQLPSHAFSVEYDGGIEEFVFTAGGLGHGVGMSQMGAQQMARDGGGYEDILTHYYSGVSIR